MERLYDINGSFYTLSSDNNDDNMWYGRIIVDDNNYFEGVIKNLYYDKLFFTFGRMDKSSMLLFTGDNELDSIPKQYSTQKVFSDYQGIYSAKDAFAEVAMGECSISVSPAERIREVTDQEISFIKRKIKEEKEKINEITEDLYLQFISEHMKEYEIKK